MVMVRESGLGGPLRSGCSPPLEFGGPAAAKGEGPAGKAAAAGGLLVWRGESGGL